MGLGEVERCISEWDGARKGVPYLDAGGRIPKPDDEWT